jgi:5'-nucleotidase
MNNRKEIDKLALIHIKDNQLLVALSKGSDTFYIPGGKREEGETDEQALIREISEELSIDLIPSSIKHAETFRAQAHGKPEGVMVKIACYNSDYTGEIKANSEIQEVKWLTYEDKDKCSAVTQIIMDWLKAQGQLIPKNTLSNDSKEEKELELTLSKAIEQRYSWVLFDADETLFHFDAFAGLKLMFSKLNVDFTENDYAEYQTINKPLWVHYQNGAITAEELQCQRFNAWGIKLNIQPKQLNTAFLDAMAEICRPLDGVVNLLAALKGKVKLGIITNGFTALQQLRLEKTGLKDYFEFLIVSEEVGFAKPHKNIFNHALTIMGNPPLDEVLMVGDTAESDILGGKNAGIHTCWLNSMAKTAPAHITPHYQVSTIVELEKLLLTKVRALKSPSLGKSSSSSSSLWKQSEPVAQVSEVSATNCRL